jgi:hypothetical protein
MKVKIDKDSLMVLPETDFERSVLEEMFPPCKENDCYKAFLKYGLSGDSDSVVGLKVEGIEK